MKINILGKVLDTQYICYISEITEWNRGSQNIQMLYGMKFDINFYNGERTLPILYPEGHNGLNPEEWRKEHKPKFQKLHDELMALWDNSNADIPKLTIE